MAIEEFIDATQIERALTLAALLLSRNIPPISIPNFSNVSSAPSSNTADALLSPLSLAIGPHLFLAWFPAKQVRDDRSIDYGVS
jgi:hypothetical protein